MFWTIADKAGRVLAPILIHFLVSNVIGILFTTVGLHVDAAFLTSITAVLVLPLFLWMYRKDKAAETALKDGKIGTGKEHMLGKEYVALALLGIFLNITFTAVLNLLLYNSGFSNEAQESLFGSAFLTQIVGIGIIVPVMEEVLFRGLVYKRIKGYTKTIWPGILAAAGLFAAYHGNVIQMLFAFPMGIILILIYRKWDDLKAPITFHAAVNLSSILLTAFGQGLW